MSEYSVLVCCCCHTIENVLPKKYETTEVMRRDVNMLTGIVLGGILSPCHFILSFVILMCDFVAMTLLCPA